MEIATRSKAQHKGNNRATYVLVPGGWHGSRCWKRGRKALQDAGHEVFTPSLTGVCERSYLNSATVNLSTHIADVVNPSPVGGTLGCDSLRPLLRGFVISGVADQIPDQIRSLVYLDAFVPEDGECLSDHRSHEQVLEMRQQVQTTGDGWKVAPIPAEVFNVNSHDSAWVNAQCTPLSLACLEEPIRLGVASLASRTSPIFLRQDGVAQVAHQFRPLTNARR